MMSELAPGDIPHEVDEIIINCSDHRFQEATASQLGAEHGIDVNQSDRIIYPGASKAVADGTLLPAIKMLEQLHHFSKIWLVDHTDCGGFGGLRAFGGDEQKEIAEHAASIERAKKAVADILPHMTVVSFIADLKGNLISR